MLLVLFSKLMVALKCEVADTPTSVVMKCSRGIRS